MHSGLKLIYGLMFSSLIGTSAMAQTDVTFVTWGGNIAKEMKQAWFTPATKGLNVNILEDSLKGSNDVAAHVAAGTGDWDVVDASAEMCEKDGRAGFLEELDYNVVKTDGLPKDQVTKWSVPSTAYTMILAYNKKTYGDHPPRNWKDFFDVKKFPGTRFFGPYVEATLEIALLADGVEPSKLYPLDVDRAFRKLKEFAPNVTGFPATFGVATQMVMDGEADMLFLPENRLFAALRAGANYGYTYDQGILNFDCLVVPKGTKHKDLAMKIIAGIVTPEINARIAETSGLSPANLLSIEKGFVPAKLVPDLVLAPQNFPKVVMANNVWWAENRDRLRLIERYNELKAR